MPNPCDTVRGTLQFCNQEASKRRGLSDSLTNNVEQVSFREFQEQTRLYVIGALDVAEIEEFAQARKEFGQKAEDVLKECHALHENFALSLRSVRSSDALKQRLMSMVRERQQHA